MRRGGAGNTRRTGPLVAALEMAAVWVGSDRERMAIRCWATTGVAPQREGEVARVAALESSRRWVRRLQHCAVPSRHRSYWHAHKS